MNTPDESPVSPGETIGWDFNEVIASLSAQLAARSVEVAKLESALANVVRASRRGAMNDDCDEDRSA
jgi:hypothetical protein